MKLDTQQAMRRAKKLPFCYLCGEELSDPQNDDHVPPNSIFLLNDRDFPLILPTHENCNVNRSHEDQLIGQLIALLHKKSPNTRHKKLDVKPVKLSDGNIYAAVINLDFRSIIRRWVRGFNAALYKEFLLDDPRLFMTTTPLQAGNPIEKGGKLIPIPDVVPKFIEEIKCNRTTGTLDSIVCRNGKCVYECVWTQADRGQWICIYALNLYNWIDLGNKKHFKARGCVGCYRRPQGGTPKDASTATRLSFSISNQEPLNPFGK